MVREGALHPELVLGPLAQGVESVVKTGRRGWPTTVRLGQLDRVENGTWLKADGVRSWFGPRRATIGPTVGLTDVIRLTFLLQLEAFRVEPVGEAWSALVVLQSWNLPIRTGTREHWNLTCTGSSSLCRAVQGIADNVVQLMRQ